jgi:hypothetical protein
MGGETDLAGNGELGVLGIFLTIAVTLYIVTWTVAGPPGTVPASINESVITASEPPAADWSAP